ncbi:MAG: DoxX family membrane protein [Gemmatimonadaceae bacterium]
MRAASVAALRISLGLLMIVWGLDKLANPAHGLAVAKRFYFGLFASERLLPTLGIVQIALGVLVALGLFRRVSYPLLAAVTGLTMIGVWRSIVDPWGWMFERTNALFFPSLIIFAGVLVVWAFRDDDRWVIDARFVSRSGRRRATTPA